MTESRCENCRHFLSDSQLTCDFCGFPQKGTKAEKITYNTRLFKVGDWLEVAEKSIKSIFSIALIFFFMAAVVLAFSLIFNENHYSAVLLYAIAGKIYYLLSRLGRRSAYLMTVIALFFYLAHTIFEFSSGMIPQSPLDVEESFTRSKGLSLIYGMIPIAYLVFRVALMLALGKYLLIQIRLRQNQRMVNFLRNQQG